MQENERTLILKRPGEFRIFGDGAEIGISGLRASIIVGRDAIYCNHPSEIRVDGAVPDSEKTEIRSGCDLEAGGVRITLLDQRIIVDPGSTEVQTTLAMLEKTEIPFDGFPNYKRSPRIVKRVEDVKIQLANPKDPASSKSGGLLMLILPPLVMVIVTVLVSVLMKRGLFILMAVAGTGMSLIVSVTKYVTDKKETKEDAVLRRTTYDRYLLQKRKEIYRAFEKEKEAYRYNYPSLENIDRMVTDFSPRLYERTSMDDDFLKVSLGTAKTAPGLTVEFQEDELRTKKDELVDQAEALRSEYAAIEKPVVIDLKKAHLGLVGEEKVVHEQIKAIMTQLTFFHSYHDLEVVVIYNQKYDEDFQWMKWYPHLRIHAINCVGLINSERKRDQILGSMHQILKERKNRVEESKKESMFLPHFLFIIDEPKLIIDHSIMEYLDKDGYNIGFSIIYTSLIRANLPENIGTVAELLNSEEGRLVIEEKTEKGQDFRLASVKGLDLPWISRNIGMLNHLQGISAQIPKSITFFAMYGVQKPEELMIPQRWKRSDSSKSLAVPIGVRAEEDYVFLNLHEKAHGPHGLVAGTTGSGKSELVQTYIMSLAVNFSPYEVAFLLIDYKGGGMADLFRNLPHLLGTITNLDGSQSMRAMASIHAELARRQEIFNQYHVNHINSYNTLFRNGEVKEPLPHLFIISDEFAELKKEQPDFMKELVSTARIGRSLGVHLILATQKPSGVVDDQIWSNSKFKLALKVQNEADSKEILKTPDAANITEPGRAYLQVGNNEIYELFQSAWSGAPYNQEEGHDRVDDRVYIVNELGQGELVNRDLSDFGGGEKLLKTQLDVLCDYIHNYYASLETLEITKPWLPPLADQIVSDQTLVDAHKKGLDLSIPVGLIDIPEEQKQISFVHNPVKDGNLLYVAAPGFGKTMFLMTAALTLAMKNSVSRLNMYVLDFGNSGLIPLKKLHHVADYIAFDDTERFTKVQGILEREMTARKKLLAEAAVQSFEVYNQVAAHPLKSIVILLDNMDAVKEMGIEVEEYFTKLIRDGVGLGIYVIGTSTRGGGIRYATLTSFRNKICGYVVDESDIPTIVGRTKYKQTEIRGRAFTKVGEEVCFMQIYSMVGFVNEIEYNKKTEELIAKINDVYPDERAPKIPVLPEELPYTDFEKYFETDVSDENGGEEKKMQTGTFDKKDIYLGLDKEMVVPCGMNNGHSPFLIIGEAKRGRTNALKIALAQLVKKEEASILLVDSRALDLFYANADERVNYFGPERVAEEFPGVFEEMVKAREEMMRGALAENRGLSPKKILETFPPSYLLIDDVDDFAAAFAANILSANKVAELLDRAANVGICVIVTANAGKFKGFDAVTKFFRNTTEGLMVGNQGTAAIFPINSMKDMPAQKDGLLWHNGSCVRIRIPRC
uniref:Type VII secretion protein EssC, C-terminal domain n=1 Tax=Eubacterium cellulosolvens (strain ATCC 43171 / JCM 9499 / 6) TaxID=633697 RepID=I5ASE3_EUBC6